MWHASLSTATWNIKGPYSNPRTANADIVGFEDNLMAISRYRGNNVTWHFVMLLYDWILISKCTY